MSIKIDECKSRVVREIPEPSRIRLKTSALFAENGEAKKSSVEILISHFHSEGRLEEEAALKIIDEASKVLQKEKNLVEISPPVLIVGDLHGQFYDLLQVLNAGLEKKKKFLFLGDYVDRGNFGVEIILLLYFLKITYPQNFTLLRGNHECAHLTAHYTFLRECQIKYSLRFYRATVRSFFHLPIACLIEKKILCVHGGLSPSIARLKEINKINRDMETPTNGELCDLLWSDPAKDYDQSDTKAHFVYNETRGCAYFFSYSAVITFLKRNNLLCIIRAHEPQDLGVRLYRKRDDLNFPSLITIFSAPNYLGFYGNKGAFIDYEENCMRVRTFSSIPNPFWLPNFIDVFTWSLPFMAEKINEILLVVLNLQDSAEMKEMCSRSKEKAYERIRVKIKIVGRLSLLFSEQRVKNELFLESNGILPESFVYAASNDSLSTESFTMSKHLSCDELKKLNEDHNECLPSARGKIKPRRSSISFA